MPVAASSSASQRVITTEGTPAYKKPLASVITSYSIHYTKLYDVPAQGYQIFGLALDDIGIVGLENQGFQVIVHDHHFQNRDPAQISGMKAFGTASGPVDRMALQFFRPYAETPEHEIVRRIGFLAGIAQDPDQPLRCHGNYG